jgi:dynein heavy chain
MQRCVSGKKKQFAESFRLRHMEYWYFCPVQMLTLLEGLLPDDSEAEAIRNTLTSSEKKVVESEVKKIYVFCLAWSIGGYLESEDRQKIDEFLRQPEHNLPMPEFSAELGAETVFDYLVEGDKWVGWKNKVENYTFPENYISEFSTIMVPNVDNVRTNFLIDTVAKQVSSTSFTLIF